MPGRELAVVALGLWLGACGPDSGPPATFSAPPTIESMRADAGTGFDYDFDQADIPPEQDPSGRLPSRHLPTPSDEGVLSLVDAGVPALPFDGGRSLDTLSAADAETLCELGVAHVDAQASPLEVGHAECIYTLAGRLGFEDATDCEITVEIAGGCAVPAPLGCGPLQGCAESVETFGECMAELGLRRAAFAALFGDCARFDAPPGAEPSPALAGQLLACDALAAACPGALRDGP